VGVTELIDNPDPLRVALLKTPAVVLVKVIVCDVVLPPTADARVTGFGDHVIPLAVPLPFTVRLTVMVTALPFESVTYTEPVVPVVSEFIYDVLGAMMIVPEPDVKSPEVVVEEPLANSQALEGFTMAT